MSRRSQTAKIHPLAVAMVKAGVRPHVVRRQVGVLIPFPLGRDGRPARRPLTATPLIALTPWRHAPLAFAALAAGWGVVALLLQMLALAR